MNQRQGAADRPRRSVEEREEAVARRPHLAAAEARELIADPSVMRLEHIRPRRVPELPRPLGGPHDVGEQHRRQHSVGLGPGSDPGQELLDLAQDRVRVADPGEVVIAGQLHKRGIGNALGEVTASSHRDHPIT